MIPRIAITRTFCQLDSPARRVALGKPDPLTSVLGLHHHGALSDQRGALEAHRQWQTVETRDNDRVFGRRTSAAFRSVCCPKPYETCGVDKKGLIDVGSWFSRRETTNVPSQPEFTVAAETEARLRNLERHRPEYQIDSDTRLDDLERRLRETAEWCRRHIDSRAIGTCLRARSVAPQFLARDRWRSAHDVTMLRRQELDGIDFRSLKIPRGRLLV